MRTLLFITLAAAALAALPAEASHHHVHTGP